MMPGCNAWASNHRQSVTPLICATRPYRGEHFAVELRNRPARERHVGAARQFTGEPLNVVDDAGGKAGSPPASWLFLEAGQAFLEEAMAPFADNLA